MDDLISRQAAIDAIFSEPLYKSGMKKRDADVVVPVIYEKIKSLPSAQPEPCEDAVSRQAVYNVLDKMPVRGFKKDGETIHGLISLSQVNSAIINLPSAQPEIIRCKDCKYSDTDNTLGVMFCWRVSYHEASEDGFCSWAERRTDGV